MNTGKKHSVVIYSDGMSEKIFRAIEALREGLQQPVNIRPTAKVRKSTTA